MRSATTPDMEALRAEVFAQARAVSLKLPNSEYRSFRFGLALCLMFVVGALWIGALIFQLVDHNADQMIPRLLRHLGSLVLAVVITLRLWRRTWRRNVPATS